jgi:basic amino acid/polyamine antiporter, APA family
MERFDLEPRRDLNLLHAASLVVGVIIGTGIFLKAASMAQAVGTPALVLGAWGAAGLVAILGALCFAELGGLLPHAGGEYVYLRTSYGEIPGFLFACNAFVLNGAAVAAYGAAVAIFVSDIHRFDAVWYRHTLHLAGLAWSLDFGMRQLIAVGVIAVFAVINCLGVMLGGRVQAALTAIKVAAVVAVAAAVFAFGGPHDWSNLRAAAGGTSGGLEGFGGAMFAALWAYSGWQFLPMAAREVREPQRNLPRAIVGGTLLVLGLYVAINAAYLYALPFWQVASANSTAYPDAPSVAARAVQTFLGGRAAPIAALIFLISTIGSLNGVILAAARVPYAAARDGLFFAPFGRLGARSRVPAVSLVLLALWATVLAVSGTFDQLTDMAVMSYAVFWIPVSLSVIVLRRKLPDAPRPFRVPGYPFVPLLFALVMVWIVISALHTAPRESIATFVLIALGLPLYPLFRRSAARVRIARAADST